MGNVLDGQHCDPVVSFTDHDRSLNVLHPEAASLHLV